MVGAEGCLPGKALTTDDVGGGLDRLWLACELGKNVGPETGLSHVAQWA